MRWTQDKITAWAVKTFGYTPPSATYYRMKEEVDQELLQAISVMEHNPYSQENVEKVAEECADVVIFLMQICQKSGSQNLLEHVDRKMDIVEKRKWEVREDGHHQHVE